MQNPEEFKQPNPSRHDMAEIDRLVAYSATGATVHILANLRQGLSLTFSLGEIDGLLKYQSENKS